jgi:hypothetical protein
MGGSRLIGISDGSKHTNSASFAAKANQGQTPRSMLSMREALQIDCGTSSTGMHNDSARQIGIVVQHLSNAISRGTGELCALFDVFQ